VNRGTAREAVLAKCKECWKAYCRERRKRPDVKEYEKNYRQREAGLIKDSTITRRDKRRQIVYEYLLAHPCVDCGETDVVVLDLDHVRGKKISNVSAMVYGNAAIKKLLAEIEKCDVRCGNCHRLATERRRVSYRFQRHYGLQEAPKQSIYGKLPDLSA
jgi:hypothetical protein